MSAPPTPIDFADTKTGHTLGVWPVLRVQYKQILYLTTPNPFLYYGKIYSYHLIRN